MLRLTKAERKAALAVIGAAAAVTVSGIKLLKRHSRYVIQKAAAHFDGEFETEESEENPEKPVDTTEGV